MNKWIPVLVFIFPFSNLLHVLYPVWLLGKSAWIVLPVFIVFCAYLYLLISGKSKVTFFDVSVLVLVIVSILIFSLRWYVYSESLNLLDIRYVWTSLIFLGFTRKISRVPRLMDTVAFSVLTQAIFNAIGRIVNFYFFPTFKLVVAEDQKAFITGEGELTRDLLLSSSMAANQIVCGMIILLFLFNRRTSVFGLPAFIAIQTILIMGVVNTQSRYPMVVAGVIFVFSILQIRGSSINNIFLAMITCLGFVFLAYTVDFFDFNYIKRFSEDSGDRGDKLKIGLILIFNSFADFMIGSSNEILNNTAINGVLISDNSYTLLAISLGTPFMCCYFLIILSTVYRSIVKLTSKTVFFYIAIGFGLTNCILWEPWTLTAFLTVAFIKKDMDDEIYKNLTKNY